MSTVAEIAQVPIRAAKAKAVDASTFIVWFLSKRSKLLARPAVQSAEVFSAIQ